MTLYIVLILLATCVAALLAIPLTMLADAMWRQA
jgi:hypothetical protein